MKVCNAILVCQNEGEVGNFTLSKVKGIRSSSTRRKNETDVFS